METKKPPFLKTEYNYDTNAESDRTGLKCEDPSLAQQHFKDECDINVIFGRYLETGEMPQVQDALAYGDFTGVFDFQTAMNAVRTAEGMFSQLPARVKNRFDNDPQKLLNFLNDPENREEAEFLGIVNKSMEMHNGTTDPRTGALSKGGKETQPGPTGTQTSPGEAATTKEPGPKTG